MSTVARAASGPVSFAVLAAWTLFELASGGKTWWRFSTSTLDQHIYLAHAVFGVLVLAPAVSALLGAALRGGRAGRRALIALVALAAIGASLTGLEMAIHGSTAAWSAPRTAHAAAGAASLALVVMLAFVRPEPAATRAPAREGTAWRLLLIALAIPCAAVATTASVWPLESMAVPFPEHYYRRTDPFLPARCQTEHNGAVKLESLVTGHQCGSCHKDIYKQWLSSSHRQSTISKWYEKQVRLRMDTADVRGYSAARFCGACHEPIVELSGNLDDHGLGVDYPDNKDQGVTCVTCHRAVKIRDTVGNGSYVHGANQPYLFQNDKDPLLAAVGRGLLRAKPDVHSANLMRPQMHSSELCATCHQVFFKTLYGKLFLIQNDFDVWKSSHYNKGPGNDKTQRCQDCHMPLVTSTDPGAKHGKVHSHRFIGANTARPYQTGDKEQLARTEEFLQQAVYLNVHGPEKVEAGKETKFLVIVTNANVGHDFPGGTTDMVDAWLEAIATDGSGKQLFASGLLDKTTLAVDPGAHFYRTYPLNIYGEHLFRRDLWNTYRVKEARLIHPEKSDLATYDFMVPPGATGPVTFKARLRFRRANQKFTDYVFPDKKMDLPITDLADDSVKVSMGPATPVVEPALPQALDSEEKPAAKPVRQGSD